MKMFTALRRKDLENLKEAARVAKEAIDDSEVFAERMRTNAIFANLYQNDQRMQQLRAK